MGDVTHIRDELPAVLEEIKNTMKPQPRLRFPHGNSADKKLPAHHTEDCACGTVIIVYTPRRIVTCCRCRAKMWQARRAVEALQ